jgi:hypothetical protein
MEEPGPVAVPLRRRAGALVVTLFVVAVVAGATAAALAGVAIAGAGNGGTPVPEACCPAGGPPAQPPSPPPATPTATPDPTGPTRAPTAPHCVVGSWRVVAESYLVEFYTDAPAIPFRSSGREYEFRPDGTGTIDFDGVVATGEYRGDALRVEWAGQAEFTWSADDTTITYHAYTSADATWSTHVNSQQTNQGPFETDPDLDEVDDYRCRGGVMEESNSATGYQATWERTGDYGVYG